VITQTTQRVIVCQEAELSIQRVLHAVIEMVERTHQSRLKGGGFKLPKGAVVKSHGIERLGKGCTMSAIKYE
jgi:hypothetical protein